jgi:hypothetical protein
MRAGRFTRVIAVGATIAGIAATPAFAASEKETIPLECDNGNSYVVEVNGNGGWTPARDTESNQVFVPLAFGDFVSTVTFPDGTSITETEPGAAKGKGNAGTKTGDTVMCTFSFEGEEDGVHFEGTGSVTGYITPGGRA